MGYAMRRSRRVEMVQEERRNGLNLLGYVVIGGDGVGGATEQKVHLSSVAAPQTLATSG